MFLLHSVVLRAKQDLNVEASLLSSHSSSEREMMRGSFCAIFFILTSIAQPESCQGQGLAPGIGFSAKEIEVVRDAIARPLPDKPLEGVNEVCFNHLVAFQERVNRLFLLGGLNSSDTWALRSECS